MPAGGKAVNVLLCQIRSNNFDALGPHPMNGIVSVEAAVHLEDLMADTIINNEMKGHAVIVPIKA
ncbi:hypothetical protein ACTXT7_001519 [Hymenolepis weldensis]